MITTAASVDDFFNWAVKNFHMFILVALLCELDLCKWKVFHKTIDKRWGKKTKKKKFYFPATFHSYHVFFRDKGRLEPHQVRTNQLI